MIKTTLILNSAGNSLIPDIAVAEKDILSLKGVYSDGHNINGSLLNLINVDRDVIVYITTPDSYKSAFQMLNGYIGDTKSVILANEDCWSFYPYTIGNQKEYYDETGTLIPYEGLDAADRSGFCTIIDEV